MADSINGTAAISSLLRAQIQAPITALKSSQDAAQQLINQLQKTATPAATTSVTLTSKSLGVTDNLPRGSLVDITA
jgi:hypothetical protein